MRGIVFTFVTFLIFSGLIIYANTIVQANNENNLLITERISAGRIYYTWKGIDDSMGDLLNVSTVKTNDTIEINDNLPSERDIENLLNEYGNFINQYLKEPSIYINFEDSEGNIVELENMDSEINIKPMNINYGWPDFGKRENNIEVDETNFSFIQKIEINIRVMPNIVNVSEVGWGPYKKCTGGTKNCLYMDLVVSDGINTWTSPYDNFDVDKKSQVKIELEEYSWVRVNMPGGFPDFIQIELQKANVSSNMKLILNTSKSYINYPSKLRVKTEFGEKVDFT